MAVISIVPLVVWLWLLGASQIMRRREDDVGRLPWRHCFARVALAAWSLILLAPLIWAYCVIVAPPIPETVLPDPNGHTELVALGKRLDATIPDHDPTGQRATQQDYLDFEQQHRELFVAASNAVELPSSVPLQYDFSDMDILMDRVQHIRHLARGLAAAGKSQHIQGKHDEAVRSHVDIIRLGRSVGRGGLIVDWLVGIAIEGMGTHALSADRNRIPATQRRELIETLRKLGEDGELPELVQRRDEIWSMHAFGWPGRIVNRINAFSGQNAAWFEVYHGAANRGRAYHRILLVELALQNYHDARGYYPETLDELMPEELDELPVDPFTGEPLQYRVTGQGFIVYSVGPNRQDDAGATPGSQPSGDDVRFEP